MKNFFKRQQNIIMAGDRSKDKEIEKEKKMDEELKSDISIYTMPENFRLVNAQTNSAKITGLAIIFAGFLILAVASAVMYFYLFKDKSESNIKQAVNDSNLKNQTDNATTSDEKILSYLPQETPKEAYIRIKSAEAGTAMQSATTSGAIGEAQTNNPSYGELGEIIEIVSGLNAVLNIKTKDTLRTGIVNMSLRGNEWQIASENWTVIKKEEPITITTPDASTSTRINYQSAVDADTDGLSDKEELILGTSPDQKDSDGDTYEDAFEALNLYDPAAPDKKISENRSIKSYANGAYGYSLFYPSTWELNTKNDDSVVITSEDSQFIQIIVQTDSGKESIYDWYKKQFEIYEIDDRKLISGNGWNGVSGDDGLITYIADKNNNYIYTIAYNPGESQTLDYLNIFKIVLKSLEIK